jgi:hypothetical protein
MAASVVSLVTAGPAQAVSFFDDFENGVGGDIVWTPWGGTPGTSTTPVGNNNLVTTDTSHNITPAGQRSARVHASDPAAWNGFADFGATGDKIIATTYLFEDFNNPGTSQPVTNMLSVYGDGASPGAFSDYIQLGVVPFYPGGSQTYGFRTRYNDSTGGGIIDTGVSRKAGWTKLAIEVEALADGGAVNFYIDDALVGSSFRAGANGGNGGLSSVDLRWVRIGNNSPSYENFWYDDVSVVPEPASALLMVLAAGMVVRRRRNG